MVKNFLLSSILILMGMKALAAPRALEPEPVKSPNESLRANVEYEDVGFIGLIRMKLYAPNGDPVKTIELPKFKPEPANLNWIDDEWVACESFLGDRGSSFFYAHVPSSRGYMVEIVAPESEVDWMLSFATNDGVSSSVIDTISRDKTSLFPVLMRDLPTDGPDYFTLEFCARLREAIDVFSSWRKKEKITQLQFLSDADIHTSVGAIAVVEVDEKPEVIYFPAGTTSSLKMFEKVRRKSLPDDVREILLAAGAPDPVVKWTGLSGDFVVEGVNEDETSRTVLMSGRFEGVSDVPYVPEEPAEEPTVTPDEEKEKKKIPAAREKSTKKSTSSGSSKKKPSRSR